MDLLINRLREIKSDLTPDRIWKKVFSNLELQEFIIEDLIQQNQLLQSKTGLGLPIRNKDTGSTTYTRLTEILSEGRKKEGDPYNLYDTGEFYKSMKIILGNDFFDVESNPLKLGMVPTNLYDTYGEEIVWLSEDSRNKLRERLLEDYERELKNILLFD